MATLREPRRRKDTGLKKYIVPLYTRPVLKFLHDPDYEPVRDLIYGPGSDGPPKGTAGRRLWDDKVSRLKPLWLELREDILQAQAQYAPDKNPWGMPG